MKVPYGYLDRQYEDKTADDIWYKYVKKVVTRGDFTLGEEVRDFEREMASLIGTKYCVGVANGTDALEMACEVIGLGPGDEVITTVNTFIATVASIARCGAKPVFVDSNDKFVTDHTKIEALITEKTKAIMPVDFQGQPVDMISIRMIADKYNLKVIEDAAQAANAHCGGISCGTFSDIAGISFHPQKNMNAWGDAGCIVTNDPVYYEKLLLLRNHGMSSRDTYEFFSRNSRLDTLHAAVLLHDIKYLVEHNDRRIEIAEKYDNAFKTIPDIKLPPRDKSDRHTFHLYMFECNRRDALMRHLQYHGVDARIHYPMPLHLQNCSKHLGYKVGDFPVAERQAGRMISLPIHQFMKGIEVEYVIEMIERFYR